MFQLVYISTVRGSVPEMLDDILATSRRNNSRADVTGLLVAGQRRFLQILEGPEQAVLDTYARIKVDPRHFAIVLLNCRSVSERAFGDWAMACERGEDAVGGDLLAIVSRLSEHISDKTLRAHLIGFAELQRRAA